MIKAGVIGDPISHSKSPLIHGKWIKAYGINGDYEAIHIKPEELESQIKKLIKDGYRGFNVTIPHKVSIMNFCQNIDETAKAIGAVNTVVIEADGTLTGSNTDAFGFISNLNEACPNIEYAKGSALIIGAGGAARACAYGLLKQGIKELWITNRTKEKAEIIAKDLSPYGNVKILDWEDRNNFPKDLVILANTTALGMSGKPNLEFNLEHLPKDTIVYDIVYTPLLTQLLKGAQENGNQIVTGVGMLLHQARPGFQKWFGTDTMPAVTKDLEEAILNG